MNEEMIDFHKIKTWDLMSKPANIDVITYKYIYKVKNKSNEMKV